MDTLDFSIVIHITGSLLDSMYWQSFLLMKFFDATLSNLIRFILIEILLKVEVGVMYIYLVWFCLLYLLLSCLLIRLPSINLILLNLVLILILELSELILGVLLVLVVLVLELLSKLLL